MSIILPSELGLKEGVTHLPDHTELPESDGTFVKNFQEHPQSILLTDSIQPIMAQLHPDGQYAIGQDCGIYWRLSEPPERGAESPDWFYVPNVPPFLKGQFRRSYVLWQEYVAPLIVLEFASGDGSEERDRTPPPRRELEETQRPGKFWVYEQAIRVPFYGIYEFKTSNLEVYQLLEGHYQLMTANERGHYFVPSLGVELGLWQGQYGNQEASWLRWWDVEGNLLLTGEERAQREQERAQREQERAQREQERAQRLADKLREMGINPDEV